LPQGEHYKRGTRKKRACVVIKRSTLRTWAHARTYYSRAIRFSHTERSGCHSSQRRWARARAPCRGNQLATRRPRICRPRARHRRWIYIYPTRWSSRAPRDPSGDVRLRPLGAAAHALPGPCSAAARPCTVRSRHPAPGRQESLHVCARALEPGLYVCTCAESLAISGPGQVNS